MHVGTNDAGIKGATADKIIHNLIDFKKDIETKLPEATTVISTQLKRNDKVGTGQIIETLNKKIRGSGLNIVDNKTIDSQDLGRKGLHLNARGVHKFASNLINKLRIFNILIDQHHEHLGFGKGMTIASFNVNGLRWHSDEIQNILSPLGIHGLALNETTLDEKHPVTFLLKLLLLLLYIIMHRHYYGYHSGLNHAV